jgi:hypothetical protein
MINKKKSGIMIMYKRKPSRPATGNILDYPIVNSYKYLGTILPNYLSISNHIEALNLKV